MQTAKPEIIAQQAVLNFLGFYKGAIDGIWGPVCILAKQRYEADPSFKSIPNNGLPFAKGKKIPADLRWKNNLLWHKDLTREKYDEIIAEYGV